MCKDIKNNGKVLKYDSEPYWRYKYATQKGQAKTRGIEFLLTFEEWYSIWKESGHIHERGRGVGKYVMSRKRDQGPYVTGNVFINRCERNSSDKFFHTGSSHGRAVEVDPEEVRRVRCSENLSWKTLAERFHISKRTVGRILKSEERFANKC